MLHRKNPLIQTFQKLRWFYVSIELLYNGGGEKKGLTKIPIAYMS